MKETYTVAQNAFTVSAADDLPAWQAMKRRYSPFGVASCAETVLEAHIKACPLPHCEAEMIYEPAPSEISLIRPRASRLPDAGLLIEFMVGEEEKPRVMMTLPPAFDKADIMLSPDCGRSDGYILTHALMIAYLLATAHTGTVLIHASAVLCEGKAYLFQGKSGTGKSTHASLWTGNIAGAELLNDDHPVIRFGADGIAMAYGSPWSGKTHCYRNASAPIGAFTRIVRAKENSLHRLPPLRAYASLTASVFFMPFVGEDLIEARHKTIERLAQTVPCCEMHCRPDADAALTCRRGLAEIAKESTNI